MPQAKEWGGREFSKGSQDTLCQVQQHILWDRRELEKHHYSICYQIELVSRMEQLHQEKSLLMIN